MTKKLIDTLDTPVLDTASTSLNGSAGAFVEVVAALADEAESLKVCDQTGRHVGIYTGSPGNEVLIYIVNPGEQGDVHIGVTGGSRVSMRSMEASSVSKGKICVQFFARV